MRIAYLNPSGQLGGAEISLLDFIASLRAVEPDWSLHLIAGEEGPLVARAKAAGIRSTVVPFPPSLARLGDAGVGGPSGVQVSRLALAARLAKAGVSVAVYVKRLSRALGETAPDIIHTNGFKMHILGARACPRRAQVVWHVHDYVSLRPVMMRLMRKHAGRCAAVVANSKSVAADIQAACDGRLNVYPVYNGVDLDRFSPTGARLDLDKLSGLDPAEPGTLKVGLLATLGRWKGHTVFLKALSLLPPGIKVRGYVIGSAIYKTDGSQYRVDDLREKAALLGLGRKVGFTSFVEQPDAAMRALDIVVHASTQPEPFGLVIAEAMACGKAVIASQAGGAAEIINAGVDALGHSPGDAAGLADRIKQLAIDPALRANLGRAARTAAERRFNRARLASELIPIYRAAAGAAN
ncbi:MAG TPA: glycosyltransferase family 4 protein [Blastocatellia bacterium]|nr:glycosyltransferase family 4 protein [Blastocatellia bacterium]